MNTNHLTFYLDKGDTIMFRMCLVLKQSIFASVSLFPKTDELLNQGDFDKAILYVARRKNHAKYDSIIDFIFCETWVRYRYRCFEYYNNDGPKLKEQISEREAREYDDYMSAIMLPTALKHYMNQSNTSWSAFISECNPIYPPRWWQPN